MAVSFYVSTNTGELYSSVCDQILTTTRHTQNLIVDLSMDSEFETTYLPRLKYNCAMKRVDFKERDNTFPIHYPYLATNNLLMTKIIANSLDLLNNLFEPMLLRETQVYKASCSICLTLGITQLGNFLKPLNNPDLCRLYLLNDKIKLAKDNYIKDAVNTLEYYLQQEQMQRYFQDYIARLYKNSYFKHSLHNNIRLNSPNVFLALNNDNYPNLISQANFLEYILLYTYLLVTENVTTYNLYILGNNDLNYYSEWFSTLKPILPTITLAIPQLSVVPLTVINNSVVNLGKQLHSLDTQFLTWFPNFKYV